MRLLNKRHTPMGLFLFVATPVLSIGGVISQGYNFEAYGNSLDGPPTTVSGPCTAQSFTSQTLSLTNCTASGAGVTTSAHSLATFSSLKVDASLTLTNASLPSGIISSAYARTEDFLTVQNGANVQFLAMTMHLDGTLINSGISLAKISLAFGFDYENPGSVPVGGIGCSVNLTSTGSQNVDTTCSTGLLPISYWLNHPYWFSLSDQLNVNSAGSPVTGSGTGNFFNTAVITSVSPYDGAGNFLKDVTVSSNGNGGVPFAVAPMPEPSTFGLIAATLAALGMVIAFRWRKLDVRSCPKLVGMIR